MASEGRFRRSSKLECYFCHKPIVAGEPHRYIYPIPLKPVPTTLGAVCCLVCAPEIEAKQVQMGLVGRVETTPLRPTTDA